MGVDLTLFFRRRSIIEFDAPTAALCAAPPRFHGEEERAPYCVHHSAGLRCEALDLNR